MIFKYETIRFLLMIPTFALDKYDERWFHYLDSLFVHFTGRIPNGSRQSEIGYFAQLVMVDKDIASSQISMNNLNRSIINYTIS